MTQVLPTHSEGITMIWISILLECESEKHTNNDWNYCKLLGFL